MLLKFANFAFLTLSSTRSSSCNSCAYFYIAPLLYAVCSLKREFTGFSPPSNRLHFQKPYIYSTCTEIKLTSVSKNLELTV